MTAVYIKEHDSSRRVQRKTKKASNWEQNMINPGYNNASPIEQRERYAVAPIFSTCTSITGDSI